MSVHNANKTRIRLGYWDKSCSETLWFPTGDAHGLLCSPTRGGKYRDVIAQILMSFEGSCFVIDPKGQAAATTARFRQEALGQDVCVLNPFGILPEYLKNIRHARYDPVTSQLDPASPNFAADADNLMEGLMPHGGAEVHWIDSARQLGAGITIYLRESFNQWSLPDVYKTISSRDLYTFCENAIDIGVSEYVQTRLSRFSGKEAAENREIRSVVSTAITRLGFMDNKPIADSLHDSTVDFREMKKRPMTVYVILPGRYLMPYAPWLRTITNSFADACLEEGNGAVPVLGVLDEFRTTVGNLNAINTLNTLGAGYGVQLLTVILNLGQLQELMPHNWETYLANSGFQIFFRPRDWTTSDYLSKMAGDVGIPSATQSYGVKDATLSLGAQSKRYLSPEAVREIPDDEMLVFCDGVPGIIRAGRRPYYQSPEFAGRYDKDPYHATKP
jgi:type IV secretion system protein VirD4